MKLHPQFEEEIMNLTASEKLQWRRSPMYDGDYICLRFEAEHNGLKLELAQGIMSTQVIVTDLCNGTKEVYDTTGPLYKLHRKMQKETEIKGEQKARNTQCRLFQKLKGD
jgi:hypothetical protein